MKGIKVYIHHPYGIFVKLWEALKGVNAANRQILYIFNHIIVWVENMQTQWEFAHQFAPLG